MKKTLMRQLFVSTTSLLASGMALAAPVGQVTGVTASKTQVYVGEPVIITVQGTLQPGKACRLYGGPKTPYTELGLFNSFPATVSNKPFTFDQAGTYYIHAYGGTEDKEHECSGSKSVVVTVVVKPKTAVDPATMGPIAAIPAAGLQIQPPGTCPPSPYEKIPQNSNDATGKLRCVKTNPSCPQGWKQSSFNNATGQLGCVPAEVPSCPPGWTGGLQGGVLTCNSTPQPTIACPKATAANKWGTTYYKESWNILGCSENLEPPK